MIQLDILKYSVVCVRKPGLFIISIKMGLQVYDLLISLTINISIHNKLNICYLAVKNHPVKKIHIFCIWQHLKGTKFSTAQMVLRYLLKEELVHTEGTNMNLSKGTLLSSTSQVTFRPSFCIDDKKICNDLKLDNSTPCT